MVHRGWAKQHQQALFGFVGNGTSHQQPVPHLQAAAAYADLSGVPAKQQRAAFLHTGDFVFSGTQHVQCTSVDFRIVLACHVA
eukprot:15251387-Alexandrium_andersonii.AAC.1